MKILHPTDFSEGAEAARGVAMRLARAFGAELLLIHVLTEPVLYGEGLMSRKEVERLFETRRRRAEERLEARVVETHAAGIPTRGLLRVGAPADEIVRAAEEEGAGYIVIGTHGRGGLSRLLVGSVADRVVRTAPCAVVTVRERRDDSQSARPGARRGDDVPRGGHQNRR